MARKPISPPVDEASANRRTLDSYETIARDYAAETAPDPSDPAGVSGAGLRRLIDATTPGGTVLELGSGPGWDADFVESMGLTVRRTDATTAFIEFQRERGKKIEFLDVVTDDLGGPYDAIMTLAVFQHLDPDVMPAVLGRVARALRSGGTFLVALREGDGARWETGDSDNPYFVALWSMPAFDAMLREVGLNVEWSARSLDDEDSAWVWLLARNPSAS